jgi:hypothetical protein
LRPTQQLLRNLNVLEIGHLQSERSEDSEEEELVYVTARPKDNPLFHHLDGEMGTVWPSPINEPPERERLIHGPLLLRGKDHEGDRVSQMHPSAVLHRRTRLSAPAVLKRPQNKPDGGAERNG